MGLESHTRDGWQPGYASRPFHAKDRAKPRHGSKRIRRDVRDDARVAHDRHPVRSDRRPRPQHGLRGCGVEFDEPDAFLLAVDDQHRVVGRTNVADPIRTGKPTDEIADAGLVVQGDRVRRGVPVLRPATVSTAVAPGSARI